jgi:hypothetical protein
VKSKQKKIREILTKTDFVWIADPKNSKIQTKILETTNNKKHTFCFYLANFLSGFPGFSEESEKSKQKTVFLFFGFCRFYVWVSRILVWNFALFIIGFC